MDAHRGTQIVALPTFAPFGLGVEWSVVGLMLLAFFQAGAESAGMYQLLGSWGGQRIGVERTNRGLFTEFLGSGIGALFGGIGTVSYPENAGIVRTFQVGSRFVTLTVVTSPMMVGIIMLIVLHVVVNLGLRPLFARASGNEEEQEESEPVAPGR